MKTILIVPLALAAALSMATADEKKPVMERLHCRHGLRAASDEGPIPSHRILCCHPASSS